MLNRLGTHRCYMIGQSKTRRMKQSNKFAYTSSVWVYSVVGSLNYDTIASKQLCCPYTNLSRFLLGTLLRRWHSKSWSAVLGRSRYRARITQHLISSMARRGGLPKLN